MISKRDSKPFLIKFPIGVSETTKTDMLYEENWTVVYGLISNPNGFMRTNVYGDDLPFDKVIILNASSVSRKIDYDTLIMIDNIPTANFHNGDYYVRYIYPEYNGEIVIGLSKQQAVNFPKLYYYVNDMLLYYQLNFDNNTLEAYAKENQAIPFIENMSVWTRKPANQEATSHKLIVRTISKTGYDNRYKPFTRITFEEVVDNG